ncbi:MAG: hypothetical protein R3E79_44450 [Caldilineaceae bacterium]
MTAAGAMYEELSGRRAAHKEASFMVDCHFRAAGYPIGSGTVESVCKLLVQQRM